MSVWDDLPVLTQRTARCAPPKGESRLQKKTRETKDDARAETRWKRDVWLRDGSVCRWCRRQVRRCMELAADRGECHHISGRVVVVIRWDRRNGLLVCASCHERLTGKVNERFVIASKHTFTVEGVQYINGDKPVRFRRVA